MRLEGMTKLIRTGVANGTGYFAHSITWITKEFPSLGHPHVLNILMEMHTSGLRVKVG